MKNPNTQEHIEAFLALKTLAVVGVSRSGLEFSNRVYDALKQHGYRTIPINPSAATICGDPCYPTLSSLTVRAKGVVIMTAPSTTPQIVREARDLGMRHIWIHRGAQSEGASLFCREHGLPVVDGECLFMYLGPVRGGHKAHRWLRHLLRWMPQSQKGACVTAG